MHYASAMFYDGQLINAADVYQDSSKDLGLVCPNCKRPVFFQPECEEQLRKTGIESPAHFKHFATTNPAVVRKCESRVQKYDAWEIQRRAAQARNQRLKVLQSRFWSILIGYYEHKLYFPITDILSVDRDDFVAEMGYTLKNNFLSENLQALKDVILHMVEAACTDAPIIIRLVPGDSTLGMIASTAIQEDLKNSLSDKLERQLQGLIACEIMDFLQLKASRFQVEKLFTLACWIVLDAVVDGVKLGLIGADGSDLVVRSPQQMSINTQFWLIPENQEIVYHYAISYICFWLAMLPWAKQIQMDR